MREPVPWVLRRDSTNGVIECRAYLDYRGPEASTDRSLFLYASGAQLKNYGSGTLTINGDVTSNNQSLFVRGSRDITLNGLVAFGSGSLSRTDDGTLTLGCNTNTFSGNLAVYAGTISVETISDSGVISAIGRGSRIYFGQTGWETTGILQFNGASGGSCDRDLYVNTKTGAKGGVIENTVAGQTLYMSGDVNSSIGTSGIAPLWLSGDGDGEMSGVNQREVESDQKRVPDPGHSQVRMYIPVQLQSLQALCWSMGQQLPTVCLQLMPQGPWVGTGVVHGVVNVEAGGTLVPGVDGIGNPYNGQRWFG